MQALNLILECPTYLESVCWYPNKCLKLDLINLQSHQSDKIQRDASNQVFHSGIPTNREIILGKSSSFKVLRVRADKEVV